MAKATAKKSESVIGKGQQFFSGCQDELRKVSKPTRQETIQITIVTVIIMLIVAAALGLMDVAFGKLMQVVLS